MPAHQADSLWDKIYLLNIAKRSFLPGVSILESLCYRKSVINWGILRNHYYETEKCITRNGEKTLLITKARSAEQSVIWRC
ncbi:uncharacterized protein isoform X2 [Leptinotarsa decemlineata]|uniref:uncharacterized protein isoform X2 n=1 Tax=Leptinotarsa decemlineata TaxID=7539 RepID=UPI003D309C13